MSQYDDGETPIPSEKAKEIAKGLVEREDRKPKRDETPLEDVLPLIDDEYDPEEDE